MSIAEILQIVLITLNILVYIFGFYKFIRKPADNIRDRVVALEVQQTEMKKYQEKSDEKFKDQSETNEVLLHSVFALIGFEMQYCLIEGKQVSKELSDAADALHKYMYKS